MGMQIIIFKSFNENGFSFKFANDNFLAPTFNKI